MSKAEAELRAGELDFTDLIAEHARRHTVRTALVCGEERYTYREFADRAAQLAGGLTELGVGPGDRILWLGQNCHRLIEVLMGAARLGAVLCPANWRQTPGELAFLVEDLEPSVVFWQEHEVGPVAEALRAMAGGRLTWLQHDGADYAQLLAAGRAVPDRDESGADDPVLILYTAAFEGKPCGAVLTQRNLLDQSLVFAPLQEITSTSVNLACGPLFHIATWLATFPTLLMGGVNVVAARVDGTEICRLIERERCTVGFLVPAIIDQLVAANADGRYDLSSLRSGIGSASWRAMTSADTSPWGRRRAGYGQAETTGVVALAALRGVDGNTTRGLASPVVAIRVVDENESDVEPGSLGEIVVRGSAVGRGYWRRPELNAERFRGGWWHTGDLGHRETDGTVSFVGPKRRMIKAGAENIYPVEVELCIEAHPAVQEAAVIGVPDERWGQSVHAIVVLHDSASATEEEIISHCRARIASYKKPSAVHFTSDPLPRSGLGKDYDALDRQYGGGGYPGSR